MTNPIEGGTPFVPNAERLDLTGLYSTTGASSKDTVESMGGERWLTVAASAKYRLSATDQNRFMQYANIHSTAAQMKSLMSEIAARAIAIAKLRATFEEEITYWKNIYDNQTAFAQAASGYNNAVSTVSGDMNAAIDQVNTAKAALDAQTAIVDQKLQTVQTTGAAVVASQQTVDLYNNLVNETAAYYASTYDAYVASVGGDPENLTQEQLDHLSAISAEITAYQNSLLAAQAEHDANVAVWGLAVSEYNTELEKLAPLQIAYDEAKAEYESAYNAYVAVVSSAKSAYDQAKAVYDAFAATITQEDLDAHNVTRAEIGFIALDMPSASTDSFVVYPPAIDPQPAFPIGHVNDTPVAIISIAPAPPDYEQLVATFITPLIAALSGGLQTEISGLEFYRGVIAFLQDRLNAFDVALPNAFLRAQPLPPVNLESRNVPSDRPQIIPFEEVMKNTFSSGGILSILEKSGVIIEPDSPVFKNLEILLQSLVTHAAILAGREATEQLSTKNGQADKSSEGFKEASALTFAKSLQEFATTKAFGETIEKTLKEAPEFKETSPDAIASSAKDLTALFQAFLLQVAVNQAAAGLNAPGLAAQIFGAARALPQEEIRQSRGPTPAIETFSDPLNRRFLQDFLTETLVQTANIENKAAGKIIQELILNVASQKKPLIPRLAKEDASFKKEGDFQKTPLQTVPALKNVIKESLLALDEPNINEEAASAVSEDAAAFVTLLNQTKQPLGKTVANEDLLKTPYPDRLFSRAELLQQLYPLAQQPLVNDIGAPQAKIVADRQVSTLVGANSLTSALTQVIETLKKEKNQDVLEAVKENLRKIKESDLSGYLLAEKIFNITKLPEEQVAAYMDPATYADLRGQAPVQAPGGPRGMGGGFRRGIDIPV